MSKLTELIWYEMGDGLNATDVNEFCVALEKDILELIEIGGKFREPEDDLDRGVQIGYDTAKEELRLKLKEYIGGAE